MKQLLFVYNAESGFINGLIDSLHKKISPGSYPCKLCAITYGDFGMHKEWKEFIDAIPFEKKFIYKKEFRSAYPEFKNLQLPLVLLQDEKIEVLISHEDFNKITTIQDLKRLLAASY